ncbi:hypothetical protein BGZ73_000539, partial [Actinomortierella ambigua]
YPKIAFSSPELPIRIPKSSHNPLGSNLSGGLGSRGSMFGDGGVLFDLLSDPVSIPLYSPRWNAKRIVVGF